MQSPRAPVMRPVTSAAKPAEPSWAVSTNSTPPLRIASIGGSTLPLGMPKPRSIPLALSVATIRSALFMPRRSSTGPALLDEVVAVELVDRQLGLDETLLLVEALQIAQPLRIHRAQC